MSLDEREKDDSSAKEDGSHEDPCEFILDHSLYSTDYLEQDIDELSIETLMSYL